MEQISIQRVLSKLDEFLNKNDYASAERHLKYWMEECRVLGDQKNEISLLNEAMGLYRKLGKKDEAIACAEEAVKFVERQNLSNALSGATVYLNCATVYKAFGKAADSIAFFEKTRAIYEQKLDKNDTKMGGMYNNFALALVDLGRFREADELYEKAKKVMLANEFGKLEGAITLLNQADLYAAELGLEEAESKINSLLDEAEEWLVSPEIPRNGYYAFVAEKCAPVFGYYGRFLFESELKKVAKEIYEGN